ncbi:MAG: hypothetical protein ACRC6U_03690, partial [Fusobacteriaceae bacterium]
YIFYPMISMDNINFNDLDKYLNKLKCKKYNQKGFFFDYNGVLILWDLIDVEKAGRIDPSFFSRNYHEVVMRIRGVFLKE